MFVWPRGSTAAVALVFSPAYIAAIVMPVGAAMGWVFGRAWQWHVVGRVIVLIASPIALGLLTLGLARPELFPTTVVKRHAVIERVGPPRVVIGGEALESAIVSTKNAWHQVGELDGQPGEEIALVDHTGADILDSTTLDAKARVNFGGQPGRLWGSFSTLVRLPDGQLVVAQTGGGYSRTLLQDLNGAERWAYQPDPKLPPNALTPADLDEDGRLEFYGASTDRVARLDSDGREVWTRQASLAAIIAILPPDAQSPAWIVGLEYGRRALVWSPDGQLLSERPTTAENSPLTAVDSFAGRALIHGGHSARGDDLNGNVLLEVPLGDFTLGQALGIRLSAAEAPSLALVSSTDRDTDRYRFLIVGANRQTLYDEILDHYPRIIAARRADRSHALFVSGERGLRLLRRR